MSPSRPTTPASQRELDDLVETAEARTQRRPGTKASLKLVASHLAAVLAGAGALALLLFLLPAPPPSPSSVPLPGSFLFSPSRALDALCEVPVKKLLEARSGRGYFAALDDAAAALPPALHASLLFPGASSSFSSPSSLSSSCGGNGGGRLVFVGDVHGCADDFGDLLRKVGFERGRDQLVLLGDVVSKGPDSPRALRMARELGALSVRGNHDDAALAAYDYHRKHGGALPKVSSEDTGGEDFEFVKNLTRADAKYLREMPFTLRIPAVAAVAVHAGLVPGVAVNRQRPSDVFTMRGVVRVVPRGGKGGGGKGGEGGGNFVVRCWRWLLRALSFHEERERRPKSRREGEEDRRSVHGIDQGRRGGRGKAAEEEERRPEEGRRRREGEVRYRATAAVGEGVPWAKAWSSFRGQSMHVVFGHDARSGLQLEEWATGVDSNCVGSGELSALVLPLPPPPALTSTSTPEEGHWPDRGVELVSVKCRGGRQQ